MTQDLRPAIARHDELIAAVRMVRMRRDGYARLIDRAARHPYSEDIETERRCALRMVLDAEKELANVVLAMEGIGE